MLPAAVTAPSARDDWKARCKRKRKISVIARRIVIARQGGFCAWCAHPVPDNRMVIDHAIPVSRGGTSAYWNLLATCWRCNWRKRDLLPGEGFRFAPGVGLDYSPRARKKLEMRYGRKPYDY